MHRRLFAIIDVETTGGGISGNKITEICIALVRNGEVIDKYTTLVNPQCRIPAYITALTGIDDRMVAAAPSFSEVAEQIDTFTQDAIFVAHNVGFDYNVIRNEFRDAGKIYTRKRLCTVRMSRKLIPGLSSYSLGKLCTAIDIPHLNQHRAEGDVDATVQLFNRLYSTDTEFTVFNSFLNPKSKQATLPPHLPSEQIHSLPEEPGIYLFKDRSQKVIYVGKAKNIKKRVLSHFYDKRTTEYKLGQETYAIDYEATGNELLALLVESEHIRKLYPKYNKAQKWPTTTYQIISYVNQRGIIQLALGKTKVLRDSVSTFYNRTEATEKLEEICETFKLCPRYCTLQTNVDLCSHYRVKSCEGICNESEAVEDYNIKVKAAIAALKNNKRSFAIQGAGRTKNEIGFALVVGGEYKGFGFFERGKPLTSIEDFKAYLKMQLGSYHTHSIIRGFLKKNGEENIVSLETGSLAKQEVKEETLELFGIFS